MSRRSERKRISDLAVIGNTAEGRRFLKRVIEESGMMIPSIVPGMPESSHYNQGMASVGQMVWGELLVAAPEALTWIIKEQAKEIQSNNQQPEAANDE